MQQPGTVERGLSSSKTNPSTDGNHVRTFLSTVKEPCTAYSRRGRQKRIDGWTDVPCLGPQMGTGLPA